jgi:hypothetical protein
MNVSQRFEWLITTDSETQQTANGKRKKTRNMEYVSGFL